eukprot:3248059-Rhodomonas_salina.1
MRSCAVLDVGCAAARLLRRSTSFKSDDTKMDKEKQKSMQVASIQPLSSCGEPAAGCCGGQRAEAAEHDGAREAGPAGLDAQPDDPLQGVCVGQGPHAQGAGLVQGNLAQTTAEAVFDR